MWQRCCYNPIAATFMGFAVRRGRALAAGWRHREAVVVAGDLDAGGREVGHGLVHTAMPEQELVGAEPERAAEDLAAQADAEQRDSLREQAAHRLDGVSRRGRIAG